PVLNDQFLFEQASHLQILRESSLVLLLVLCHKLALYFLESKSPAYLSVSPDWLVGLLVLCHKLALYFLESKSPAYLSVSPDWLVGQLTSLIFPQLLLLPIAS